MSGCGGCAERRALLGQAAQAVRLGAWSQAARAAQAATVSARVDIARAASSVAQAAARTLAGVRR